jgi:hypothetical protein
MRVARSKAPARKSARKKPGRKIAIGKVASRLPPLGIAKTAAARRKFYEGILERNEAVPAGKPLPAGATHEIVGQNQDGSPLLKRKRFSMR